MIPHVLERIHTQHPDRAYLPSPVLAVAQPKRYGSGFILREGAFVYPSFELALRYALTLVQLSEFTMPIAAPDLKPAHIFDGRACVLCGCTESMACPSRCGWHSSDMCTECVQDFPADSWVIHRKAGEYEGEFLARRYVGAVPTEQILHHPILQDLREQVSVGRIRYPCPKWPLGRFRDGGRVERWQ